MIYGSDIINKVIDNYGDDFINFNKLRADNFVSNKYENYIAYDIIFSEEIDTIISKINKTIDEINGGIEDAEEKINYIETDDFISDPDEFLEYYNDFTYSSFEEFLNLYEYGNYNYEEISKELLLPKELCEDLAYNLDEFIWQEYQEFEIKHQDDDFYYAKYVQEQLGDKDDFARFLLEEDYLDTKEYIETAINFDEDFKDEINDILDDIQKDENSYFEISFKHKDIFIELLDRELPQINEKLLRFLATKDKEEVIEYLSSNNLNDLIKKEQVLKEVLKEEEIKIILKEAINMAIQEDKDDCLFKNLVFINKYFSSKELVDIIDKSYNNCIDYFIDYREYLSVIDKKDIQSLLAKSIDRICPSSQIKYKKQLKEYFDFGITIDNTEIFIEIIKYGSDTKIAHELMRYVLRNNLYADLVNYVYNNIPQENFCDCYCRIVEIPLYEKLLDSSLTVDFDYALLEEFRQKLIRDYTNDNSKEKYKHQLSEYKIKANEEVINSILNDDLEDIEILNNILNNATRYLFSIRFNLTNYLLEKSQKLNQLCKEYDIHIKDRLKFVRLIVIKELVLFNKIDKNYFIDEVEKYFNKIKASNKVHMKDKLLHLGE